MVDRDRRTVVITGAGGALGTAMSLAYAASGDLVVRADLVTPAPLERADAAAHPSVRCDVTDPSDLGALVATTIERTARLDVLVNCAGITHRSPATSTDPDLLARVMAVNWEGPMRLTQLALPHLADAGGSIVNLSSMAAWMPVLGRAAYGASKAALTQFMEVVRHEAAARGVNVLNVHPSFLDAVMPDLATHSEAAARNDRPTARPADRPRSSIGRVTSVDALAAAIVTSERARRRWLFPDRLARAASLLWRLAPGTYHRQMARRFATELVDTTEPAGGGSRDG